MREEPGEDAVKQAYSVLLHRKPWFGPQSRNLHEHLLPFPFATLAPWYSDAAFMAVYDRIKAITLVDIRRCYELWSLAGQVKDIEGDILEVGVWRGGTGALLAAAMQDQPGRTVYLADTFTGVVKAGAADPCYVGSEHADTSAEGVADMMSVFGLDNVEILQGVFPEETQARVRGRIALLHCDVDVYASARDAVEWCLPRLSPGSVVVFDDYGNMYCEGIVKACREFARHPGFRFLYNLNGHGIFVKVA